MVESEGLPRLSGLHSYGIAPWEAPEPALNEVLTRLSGGLTQP